MALVLPAIKATMGSTTYYEATMPAREIVSGFRAARELDEWANMTIDERMQRDPNVKRINEEIVPYLAKSKDRLFGALIILVYKGEITYEAIDGFGGKIPAAYRKVSSKIGFITIDGGELIVLDGQHRLLALRDIVQNTSGATEGEFAKEVPNDEICVIFVQHETNEKTRRIFNKVNRYAKPTSRADNIITSEDDGYAIVTRRLLNDAAPLGRIDKKDIVEWKSNTLSDRSVKLTTISAVYETVKDVLANEGIKHFDEKHQVNRPNDDELNDAYTIAEEWWSKVLHLDPFQEALADPSMIPTLREADEQFSLLFKPIGQMALFKGLVRVVQRKLSLPKALKRVPDIDWKISSPSWEHVLVTPDGRMIARRENCDLGADLIAYLIAPEKFNKEEKDNLKRAYNKARGCNLDQPDPENPPVKLPEPLTVKI